jgi:hypothetical protein
MPNEEVNDVHQTKQLLLFVEDLIPGLVVNYDGRQQQVRGFSLHGNCAVGIDEHTVTKSNLRYTVVFCDAEGSITATTLDARDRLEVRFIEVFEPGIPAGYVSRKKFKPCYEDALASTDGVGTPQRIVNEGSQWRSKKEVRYLRGAVVPEGTVCTVYAIYKGQPTCRIMRPSGGDLGSIGLDPLQRDFYYVGERAPLTGPAAAAAAVVAELVEDPVAPKEEPVLVNSEWELKDLREADSRGVGRRRWVTNILNNHGHPLCEMVDKHGTSLGHTKLVDMPKYYTFVKNDSKPSATIKVKLTYFKPSGKYYGEGDYQTEKKSFWEIVEEVYTKLLSGDNPGLIDSAVMRNDFTTTIGVEDEVLGIPHVITTQSLCAEVARRSKNDPMGFILTVPREAIELYERHRRSIDYLLPLPPHSTEVGPTVVERNGQNVVVVP